MPDSPKLRVAIIGAGGLAAAIALKDEPGVDVQIYEKTLELREVGATIALGPNGMRTLGEARGYRRLRWVGGLSERVTASHDIPAFQSYSFDEELQKLAITFTDDPIEATDILLGADGIHSPVRQFFVPTSKTRITGWTTFRSVFPMSHVEQIPDLPRKAVHIWGSDRTLFGLFSVVGSHQEDPDGPLGTAQHQAAAWDSNGAVDDLRDFYPLER
ncbi:hypothetical protein PG994_013976 [Apiospora phragmitis]|uniref:FAD-binding domain-containing protein n=1 Tax=Apiospora phragmitis TaxID=2905665 RepID=A0ABR1T511_9PEZI